MLGWISLVLVCRDMVLLSSSREKRQKDPDPWVLKYRLDFLKRNSMRPQKLETWLQRAQDNWGLEKQHVQGVWFLIVGMTMS